VRSLSLAIICLNEASNIERCIRSVPFANEIIVLDSGSTDDTQKIAKGLGAKVFDEEWRGFRRQKQRATDLCTNDWVLSLDADEALSAEAQAEIQKLFESPVELNQFDGYEFPRQTWNLGRWILHGGWFPDRQLRLFHKGRAVWRGGEHVHEKVFAEKVGTLDFPILHWPFPQHSDQVATNNRYSSLGAGELRAKGKRFSFFKLIFKPWSKFFETYLFKRGFQDGLPGFIIAVGAAYSVFLKFAKLWEIERAESLEAARKLSQSESNLAPKN
jgi:glycosyltransferase involved in cell wall biosynthesis